MGRSKLSEVENLKLWVRAAGRCEMRGCNKYLLESHSAPEEYNAAEKAHIIAYSRKGPRYIEDLSQEEFDALKTDINNLMLMCPSCHTEIDKKENLGYFTNEFLLEMKKEHEERVKNVTEITEDRDCLVVTYYSTISDTVNYFSEKRIKKELLPDYFTKLAPVDLSLRGKFDRDDTERYWDDEVHNLIGNYNRKIRPYIENNSVNTIAIFALAPIPLLIKLGVLLDDKISTAIFQKHRFPDTWKWIEEDLGSFKYIVRYPEKKSKNIALNMSLSANIDNERIVPLFSDGDVDICTITIDTPNFDFLKYKSQLDMFSNHINEILNRLKMDYGHHNGLHIFPACPASIAIETGRRWFKKADMEFIIYDENKNKGGFVEAIRISSEYEKQ